ncbi:tRNA (uridine(54)-C5)-methyltransferase TrmA [Neisseriaceae bacterium B1]
MTYTAQLKEKTQLLTQMLAPFNAPALKVYPSPEQHYRMRAEFRIWHEGETISYAMFEQGSKASSATLIKHTQFPAAHENINQLMPLLLDKISDSPILKHRLYQCEFLTSLSGETLITLIYHKKLDEHWQQQAQNLSQALNIHIIGRSKGQKIVLSQDYITESLQVAQQKYQYRQIEGSFTQPNAYICQNMLEWASEQAGQNTRDLLELYCGNGNFTLPLSRLFRRVLATEISKTSVRAAEWNIAANQIDNIAIARLSAEEFTEAFSGSREFQRLKQSGINLQNYDFSTIFIDPPRAGIDDETLKLVAQFERIIYISCNPETLCGNLETLTQTHEIQAAALFDQFPYTHHIESGVVLQKKAA